MRVVRSRLSSGLLLVILLPLSGAASASDGAGEGCAAFAGSQGGYQVSAAFTVDAQRQAVVSPPTCLRAGDLLEIRPLRLNPDEYLVLQKCNPTDCSKAEVVRAWNSSGYMGPYPVLSKKIAVEGAVRYLLWMQHVPIPGNRTFSLIDRYGPPLLFKPQGRLTAFSDVQRALEAARERGPEKVSKTAEEDGAFVATFEGGSVVRLQALRPGQ
jgi:hypothetical protein